MGFTIRIESCLTDTFGGPGRSAIVAKTQSGIGQFRLTRGEAIVLVAMQAYMLREDLDAEVGKRVRLQDVKRKLPVVGGSRPTVETKRAEYAQWSDAAVATLTKDVVASGAEWDPGQFTQNGWETLFLDQLASVTDIEEQRARLAQAAGPRGLQGCA